MGNKVLSEEELEKIAGGIQIFCDYDPPTVCRVCGEALTIHPVLKDVNAFPLFVCSSNIRDQEHWVVWERKERK